MKVTLDKLVGCYYELDKVILTALYDGFDKQSMERLVSVKNSLANAVEELRKPREDVDHGSPIGVGVDGSQQRAGVSAGN